MKVYIPRAQKYMISDKCLIDDDDDELDDTIDEAALAELEFKKKRDSEIKQLKSTLSEKIASQEALSSEIKKLHERLDELLQINL